MMWCLTQYSTVLARKGVCYSKRWRVVLEPYFEFLLIFLHISELMCLSCDIVFRVIPFLRLHIQIFSDIHEWNICSCFTHCAYLTNGTGYMMVIMILAVNFSKWKNLDWSHSKMEITRVNSFSFDAYITKYSFNLTCKLLSMSLLERDIKFQGTCFILNFPFPLLLFHTSCFTGSFLNNFLNLQYLVSSSIK